ncbi:hypothetical protein DPMN_010779 [Dreissena polymorpha]|uniref:Uncharacterized protein n=1 Tax=Dreissena polymorpha TaxID=45954 RepID=A0A9D4N2V7_DREPO|nr:hypothetical protein DPMN_010779 [Dreissena polymorpha]
MTHAASVPKDQQAHERSLARNYPVRYREYETFHDFITDGLLVNRLRQCTGWPKASLVLYYTRTIFA